MRLVIAFSFALLLALAGCGSLEAPSPAGTPIETPVPSASITETPPPPGQPRVTGLFTDPRLRAPDTRRSLGKTKPTTFKPWDGISTVLYDAVSRTETNLGEGTLGRFSPDSTKMVWVAGPQDWTRGKQEAWLLDLRTMEKRPLGPGRMAGFIDNDHAYVIEPRGSNNVAIIDLRTGDTKQVTTSDLPGAKGYIPITTPEGNVLRRTNPEQDYLLLRRAFLLTDGKTGRTLLEFEVYVAKPAGPGELVVATPPNDGTTNIFIVDIATGQATFVATARYWPPNWPLAADKDYVMWTDDYCKYPDRGTTKLYNRRTGALTEIEATLWATFTPGGLIASGDFGARALIDRETLEYVLLIPDVDPNAKSTGYDVSWSLDYRYATRGSTAGHGGLCEG
ncbi:MAG: hypothetical protein HYX92_00995 [Chloroflexi bacterium]|nr:hypothetical protein [Chloroflexota bacterium]